MPEAKATYQPLCELSMFCFVFWSIAIYCNEHSSKPFIQVDDKLTIIVFIANGQTQTPEPKKYPKALRA